MTSQTFFGFDGAADPDSTVIVMGTVDEHGTMHISHLTPPGQWTRDEMAAALDEEATEPFLDPSLWEAAIDRVAPEDRLAMAVTGDYVLSEQQRGEIAAALDGAATPTDIVDRIAATLDAVQTASRVLCACGCRHAVPDGGPSPYFATAGCQRRWHSAQATDPGDVYSRRDAAVVLVGHDDRPIPLTDTVPPPPQLAAGQRLWSPEPAEAPAEYTLPSCADIHGTAYRRHCHHCNIRVVPRVIHHDPATPMVPRGFLQGEPVIEAADWLSHECPQCNQDMLPPFYIATVAEDGAGRLVLRLSDNRATVTWTVSLRLLRYSADRPAVIDRTWAELERKLTRFRQGWRGSR